jgi:hypothetical protein
MGAREQCIADPHFNAHVDLYRMPLLLIKKCNEYVYIAIVSCVDETGGTVPIAGVAF